MSLDVDEQSRVSALAVGLQTHRDNLAGAGVQPTALPLFIKAADGSVITRAGVPLRGPIEKLPAPVK
jgi:hypothetical protein